jgi:hypothetical protein
MRLRAARYWTMGLFLAAGCSGPATGELSGKVTYDGKPVTRGILVVMRDDGELARCGISEGTYHLTAPVGHWAVSIGGGDPDEIPPMATKPETVTEQKKKQREKLEKDFAEGRIKELPKEPVHIARKYSDFTKSGLRVDVKPGQQSHDFNLSAPSDKDGE